MTTHNYKSPDPAPSHTVIEALYDLPLGGGWAELQQALCTFWAQAEASPATSDIQLLERHFQRAVSYLEQLPSQPTAWRNTLYSMPVPGAVFSPQGDFIDANPAGQALLGNTTEPDSTPAVNRRPIHQAIQALKQQPLSTAMLQTPGGHAIRLFFGELPQSLAGNTPLYLAVVVTNELPDDARALLIEQFGLTASEAQVCLHLAGGASLEDIAALLEVKKTTVRTHLANSYSKLSVNSQAELVSLVLHSTFAATHLVAHPPQAPHLTPHLDPELHGYPKFDRIVLKDHRQLGFFEYGDPDGIPAIYLHGSMDCGLIAKSQHLQGNGVRLIAVERPGVGESSLDPSITPDSYAQDLVELADKLDLPAYAVIGRSMGSWDAIALCQADPRAKLLALVSGRLPFTQPTQVNEQLPMYRALYNSLWHSSTMGKLMLRAMQLQLMVKGPKQFLPEKDLPDTELALVRNETYQRHMKAVWLRCALNGPDATHLHVRLYQQAPAKPAWQNLKTPTLLIHGELDRDAPLDSLLEQTQTFQQRQIVVLPGLAHRVVHVALGEVLRLTANAFKSN